MNSTLLPPTYTQRKYKRMPTKDNNEQRVYGGGGDGSSKLYKVLGITIIVCFVLALAGIIKAFGCGSESTSMGLTGTGWGILILVLVVFLPPVGSILGIAFALAGHCRGITLRTQ